MQAVAMEHVTGQAAPDGRPRTIGTDDGRHLAFHTTTAVSAAQPEDEWYEWIFDRSSNRKRVDSLSSLLTALTNCYARRGTDPWWARNFWRFVTDRLAEGELDARALGVNVIDILRKHGYRGAGSTAAPQVAELKAQLERLVQSIDPAPKEVANTEHRSPHNLQSEHGGASTVLYSAQGGASPTMGPVHRVANRTVQSMPGGARKVVQAGHCDARKARAVPAVVAVPHKHHGYQTSVLDIPGVARRAPLFKSAARRGSLRHTAAVCRARGLRSNVAASTKKAQEKLARAIISKCVADKRTSLGELVQACSQAKLSSLKVPRAGFADANEVVLAESLQLDAASGTPLPPPLTVPLLVVQGPATQVRLRFLTLGAASVEPDGALLEIRDGASCELIDCHFKGGGIRLIGAGTARFVRTRVLDAPGPGISANGVDELHLEGCSVRNCKGDGLRISRGRQVQVVDCTFSHNSMSGAVVGVGTGSWQVSGCTLTSNGHYGVWANGGARVDWGCNSVLANAFGARGGKGVLDAWRNAHGFRAGSACAVWSGDHGKYFEGSVLEFDESSGLATVSVKACGSSELSQTRARAAGTKTTEVATAAQQRVTIESVNSEGNEAEHIQACPAGADSDEAPLIHAVTEAGQSCQAAKHAFDWDSEDEAPLVRVVPEVGCHARQPTGCTATHVHILTASESNTVLRLTVPLNSLRQPRSGDRTAPLAQQSTSTSAAAASAPSSVMSKASSTITPVQLFLSEGGASKAAWSKLSAVERQDFTRRARALTRQAQRPCDNRGTKLAVATKKRDLLRAVGRTGQVAAAGVVKKSRYKGGR